MAFTSQLATLPLFRLIAYVTVGLLIYATSFAADPGDRSQAIALESAFATPPAEARPWVYWTALSGNLTKEGITADLESMARVGIGGTMYMEVGQTGSPAGKADFAGPLWREMMQHACKEAARLGLEINMMNNPGWCGSGGPWITPELSMQKVVWTETLVTSETNISIPLPQPKAVGNFYRDIAVLAVPARIGDGIKLADYGAKLSSSGTEIQPGRFKLAKPTEKHAEYLQIEFPKPFTAYSMSAIVRNIRGELQVSDDGENFKTVQSFIVPQARLELDFGPVTARYFRLNITKSEYPREDFVNIFDIDLSPRYRVPSIAGKAGFLPERVPPLSANFPSVPASMIIARDQIKNISTHMDASGKLTWEAPSLESVGETPGRWLILRFGHTSTGKDNHPAPINGAHGLECDKLSKQAAKVAFDGLMGKLIEDNKVLIGQGKVLVSTHIDSWESGPQNWTPLMREEFKQRCGYDLLSYLPVFTGRVVDSAEVSERFLWDLRLSISDMLAENYAAEFRRMANEHGMRLSIEAYDTPPTDDMKYAGQADEPMAEFWSWARFNINYSCTEMSSAAHTYGKKILGAEAFTSGAKENWRGHPASLKDLGDWAFTEGINRFVVSLFAAQPWTNVSPGMAMGPWGMHYERTQTWWEQSKPWHEYLARCQYMLRQGLFVADVLYFQPEGAPRRFTPPPEAWAQPYLPGVPPYVRGGYNFDGCNSDVLLNRLTTKDGKFVLPDGLSYRVLVLPPVETMTPRVLRKLKELADQGATIIADAKPPVKSPSLSDYGAGDESIKVLTAELWPKLVTGKTASQLLGERGIKPDFSVKPMLRYIHRATADMDLYFIANPKAAAVDTVAEFRITGKQPEFWWPDTGRMELAKDFEITDSTTRVPLRLDPIGSVFVVFRKPTNITKGTGKNWIETMPAQEITGPWTVSFDPKWGGPAQPVTFDALQDWSKHADAGIKYYSGGAVYQTKFQAIKGKYLLDLGKVAIMADVKLNGKPLGILWKAPFRVDASEAIQDGENTLEIKVVNLWVNRLIGDEELPEDSDRNSNGALLSWPQWLLEGKPSPTGRYTFCTTRVFKKNDPLVESGLIGPVSILKKVGE